MTQVLQGSTIPMLTQVSTKLQYGKQLEALSVDTDHVVNVIDLQTSEKLWNSLDPTSQGTTSLTVNVPSINGNHISRRLNMTGSVSWSISGTTVQPAAPVSGINKGTSPFFWNPLQSTIDTFIMSKAFYRRTFTINNSASTIVENMTPELCDAMASTFDQQKLRDLRMEHLPPCGFYPMAQLCGEFILSQANTEVMTLGGLPPKDLKNGVYAFGSYALNRNTGSYITGISVTYSNAANSISTSTEIIDFLGIPVPVETASTATVYYGDLVQTITVSFNEDLVSSYFYNNYMDDKLVWNRDLPASSFNVKFDIDTGYLQRALKFNSMIYNTAGAQVFLTPSQATISNFKLGYLSYGVPNGLDIQQSYKLLVYQPNIYQSPTNMTYTSSNETWSGSQNYSSLSRIPQYLMIYANINQSNVNQSLIPGNMFPSTLNLPITSLTGTFNSDSGLFTFSLTQRELLERTLKNLSQDRYLHAQIVGENLSLNPLYNASSTTQQYDLNPADSYVYQNVSYWASHSLPTSQVYILKIGDDLRIPSNLCPNKLVNYNLTLNATCDISDSTAPPINTTGGFGPYLLQAYAQLNGAVQLNTYFFTKQIVRITNQTLDIIDINSNVDEYQRAQVDFIEMARDTRNKDLVLNMDMMVGGGFFSSAKNLISKAIGAVPGILKHARHGIDFIKNVTHHPVAHAADLGLKAIGYGGRKQHSVRLL